MTDPLFESWRERAKCATTVITPGKDPFYPEGHINGRAYNAARKICFGCPVQRECLQDALRRKDAHGFRAGFTPDELRARMRLAKEPPTEAHTARVANLTKGTNPGQTARGNETRKRIAELALTGMGCSKIAANLGLAAVTVSHHLKDLRARSVIPITAGTAGVTSSIEHGTKSGYSRHRRDKTKPCRECMDALNAYERERRAARKAEAP